MGAYPEPMAWIGDNSGAVEISIRAKMFNSIRPADGGPRLRDMVLHAGATLKDVVQALNVDPGALFIVWANGRDVSKQMCGDINLDYVLEDGDEIALSGPIPYSWGYGSPVV